MICDKCKYQAGKGKCKNIEVMAMTMRNFLEMPKYKEFTEKEIEYLSKEDTDCWAFKEKVEDLLCDAMFDHDVADYDTD